MEYERCTRKKLTSLFEYLDSDRDGRVTVTDITHGLQRLQTAREVSGPICEFAVEELLRCVPR